MHSAAPWLWLRERSLQISNNSSPAPWIYAIKAAVCSSQDTNTITQDERDIIRQEFVHNGVTIIPARQDFMAVTDTAHFSAAQVSQSASYYNLMVGNCGPLAEAVRAEFNQRLRLALGNPTFPDQNLVLTSGWRNPERNLHPSAGGGLNSLHQYGVQLICSSWQAQKRRPASQRRSYGHYSKLPAMLWELGSARMILVKYSATYQLWITSMFKTNLLRTFTVATTIWMSQIASGNSDSVDEQYRQVKNTIEANCADCYGASGDKFVGAVKTLEKLIADGLVDPEASRLLADSYRVWALAYAGDGHSPQSQELLRKEQTIYADLVKKDPADAKLWLAYSRTLSEPSARLEALKRAESLDPEDALVQDQLGMLYAYGLGKPKDGIAHLERAIALDQGYPKATYMEHLARVLESIGNDDKAAQVRSDKKAFEQELETKERLKQAQKQGG